MYEFQGPHYNIYTVAVHHPEQSMRDERGKELVALCVKEENHVALLLIAQRRNFSKATQQAAKDALALPKIKAKTLADITADKGRRCGESNAVHEAEERIRRIAKAEEHPDDIRETAGMTLIEIYTHKNDNLFEVANDTEMPAKIRERAVEVILGATILDRPNEQDKSMELLEKIVRGEFTLTQRMDACTKLVSIARRNNANMHHYNKVKELACLDGLPAEVKKIAADGMVALLDQHVESFNGEHHTPFAQVLFDTKTPVSLRESFGIKLCAKFAQAGSYASVRWMDECDGTPQKVKDEARAKLRSAVEVAITKHTEKKEHKELIGIATSKYIHPELKARAQEKAETLVREFVAKARADGSEKLRIHAEKLYGIVNERAFSLQVRQEVAIAIVEIERWPGFDEGSLARLEPALQNPIIRRVADLRAEKEDYVGLHEMHENKLYNAEIAYIAAKISEAAVTHIRKMENEGRISEISRILDVAYLDGSIKDNAQAALGRIARKVDGELRAGAQSLPQQTAAQYREVVGGMRQRIDAKTPRAHMIGPLKLLPRC